MSNQVRVDSPAHDCFDFVPIILCVPEDSRFGAQQKSAGASQNPATKSPTIYQRYRPPRIRLVLVSRFVGVCLAVRISPIAGGVALSVAVLTEAAEGSRHSPGARVTLASYSLSLPALNARVKKAIDVSI